METNSLIRFFLKLNKASLQKLCCIRNLRVSDKLHQEFGQSWWCGLVLCLSQFQPLIKQELVILLTWNVTREFILRVVHIQIQNQLRKMKKEDNFFNVLFENRPSKIIGAIFSIILSLLTFVSVYGIIWYERFGSDLKRIFINRIVSSVCWTMIVWLLMIQIPELFIFFYHSLPPQYCQFHMMMRGLVYMQAILFLDVIVIARYIFIIWMKNPLSFQDDFWYLFVNLWVVFLG